MRTIWVGALVLAGVAAAGGSFLAVDYLLASQKARFAANDPALLICEAVILARLKSPASYKRVTAAPEGKRMAISYDAVNSFNAPIRGRHVCEFEFDTTGQTFSFFQSGDTAAPSKGVSTLSDEIKAAAQDGSFTRRKSEFDRKIAAETNDAMETFAKAVLDAKTAEGTELQPFPAGKTLLRP